LLVKCGSDAIITLKICFKLSPRSNWYHSQPLKVLHTHTNSRRLKILALDVGMKFKQICCFLCCGKPGYFNALFMLTHLSNIFSHGMILRQLPKLGKWIGIFVEKWMKYNGEIIK
ncbi:hypothetical protein VP01_4345g2, partial [Puccinia sorghi]